MNTLKIPLHCATKYSDQDSLAAPNLHRISTQETVTKPMKVNKNFDKGVFLSVIFMLLEKT